MADSKGHYFTSFAECRDLTTLCSTCASFVDFKSEWTIDAILSKYVQKLSDERALTFLVALQGEGYNIRTSVKPQDGKSERSLEIEFDTDLPAGSKAFNKKITTVRDYHISIVLPGPFTMYLIGAKLPALFGSRYVAGAALDLFTQHIFSGALASSSTYQSWIDNTRVGPESFEFEKTDPPVILMVTFLNDDYLYPHQLEKAIRDRIKSVEIHRGGIPCLAWNLILLTIGTWDALIDARELSQDSGRWAEYRDFAGLIPFLNGIGCRLCTDDVNMIVGSSTPAEPVSLVASFNSGLADALVEALREVKASRLENYLVC